MSNKTTNGLFSMVWIGFANGLGQDMLLKYHIGKGVK